MRRKTIVLLGCREALQTLADALEHYMQIAFPGGDQCTQVSRQALKDALARLRSPEPQADMARIELSRRLRAQLKAAVCAYLDDHAARRGQRDALLDLLSERPLECRRWRALREAGRIPAPLSRDGGAA